MIIREHPINLASYLNLVQIQQAFEDRNLKIKIQDIDSYMDYLDNGYKKYGSNVFIVTGNLKFIISCIDISDKVRTYINIVSSLNFEYNNRVYVVAVFDNENTPIKVKLDTIESLIESLT